VQRHGDYDVIPVIDRQGTIHETREAGGERAHAGILQQVDEFAQCAFIEAEAGGAVETAEAGAAKGADSAGIEREGILKRRVAGGAEIIGFEGCGGVEAGAADRDAGETVERGVANAALGREKKRKNSVGDRAEAEGGRSR